MSRPWPRFPLGVWILLPLCLLSARVVRAEQVASVTLVGEVETLWGPFTPCGHNHVIGEVDVLSRQVEMGEVSDQHIVVEISCPQRWALHERLRFHLATRRPFDWPQIAPRSRRNPRYYLIRAIPLESR